MACPKVERWPGHPKKGWLFSKHHGVVIAQPDSVGALGAWFRGFVACCGRAGEVLGNKVQA